MIDCWILKPNKSRIMMLDNLHRHLSDGSTPKQLEATRSNLINLTLLVAQHFYRALVMDIS